MIRVGQTRNLLRASSSLLEMWTRSAHHHPGQRRHVSRTNGPDKSTHSITCPDRSEIPCKPSGIHKSGIHKRRFDLGTIPSAICPRESVLPMVASRTLSHFRSCDGGSVGFVLRLVERRHVHVLAGRPLGAGDVPEFGLRRGSGRTDRRGMRAWDLIGWCSIRCFESLAGLCTTRAACGELIHPRVPVCRRDRWKPAARLASAQRARCPGILHNRNAQSRAKRQSVNGVEPRSGIYRPRVQPAAF